MISYQLEQAFPEALGELAMRVDREGRKPLAIRSMGGVERKTTAAAQVDSRDK